MNLSVCPFCSKKQTQEPVKTWKYGKMIISRTEKGTKWGSAITCSRFNCKCGKKFNSYNSAKGKSWTIPKNTKKD